MRPCRQRGRRTRIRKMRLCCHEGRRTRGAAALPSRRMTYSQRWDCGLAIPQDDVLASENAALPPRRTAYSRRCGLPSRRMTYSQRWDCGLAIPQDDVLASKMRLCRHEGGGVLRAAACHPQDDVLASEGLGKHHRAGSPITQRDDGHAGLDDDCVPAMTRRAGRAVCARTDAACPGVMLIAGQITMKPSRLFYKRARCLGFQIFLEHGGNPSSVNPAAGRTLLAPARGSAGAK